MEQKKLEWLKKEVEKWVEDGIITPQQGSQIQMRYPINKAGNPLLLFFAVIGSLLVGTGIILVFATNWWKLPTAIKVVLAFLPLLAAQGICLYIYFKKYASAAYREGGALFLSLSFFAALGLIGQIFHTASDVESYMLVCILFTLPAVYLFRSRAAISICVFGSIISAWGWPEWMLLLITVLCLPYFYFTFVNGSHRGGVNYLLLLLSVMVINTAVRTLSSRVLVMEGMLLCGMLLLLIDTLFRKITSVYFFTFAKFLGIFFITGTILATAVNLSYTENVSVFAFIMTAVIAIAYLVLRPGKITDLSSSDLMLVAAVILLITANTAGFTALLLAIGLGIFYIVQGSRTLLLKKVNYGMALVILTILTRFFDSTLGLFGRGIIFILAGSVFLGINLYISRKRKERQA